MRLITTVNLCPWGAAVGWIGEFLVSGAGDCRENATCSLRLKDRVRRRGAQDEPDISLILRPRERQLETIGAR
jgi:hypothetical protein